MSPNMMSQNEVARGTRVLFKLSGSIAAYKACHVISRLVQAGCEVRTVASRAALEFVGAATLEGLSGSPVHTETFATGSQMHHIHLMKWADIIVLCPATANTINKLAAGIGDDLLSTLFLAHDFQKPYLIAPAMNTNMYQHPATQTSITKLRQWGIEVFDTASGRLACGDQGEGKLLDPDLLLEEILRRAPSTETRRACAEAIGDAISVDNSLDILITAGGTKEPIDAVRSITNTSTGLTGALIADALAARGHRVLFVHGHGSRTPQANERAPGSKGQIELMPFVSFHDLDETLRRTLQERRFDAVIHMAAVSDYSVDQLIVNGQNTIASNSSKLDSGESVSILLKRNHKILPRLKDYARDPRMTVVGFKLTANTTPESRRHAVERAATGVDLIVHNDASEISPRHHPATFFVSGREIARTTTKSEMAARLEEFIVSRSAANDAKRSAKNSKERP